MPLPPHLFDEIVHKALASDIRRKLLLALNEEKYLTQIAHELKRKPQTIDFHLNILAEIGLVESSWKEGKKYYKLSNKEILKFIEERKPLPEKFHHKPPHVIVDDAMDALGKQLDRIEKKLDLLLKKK
jgi:DNA-binding transcriptional ArsR family regulator